MYSAGKTAQIEKEMDRYKLDILGLSEVRWTNNGKITLQSGKSILYSGREDDLHQEGVGIILSKRAKKAMLEWKPINERLMYVRLYTSTLKISIIVAYAPTNDSKEEKKEQFLEHLQEVINSIPKHDILLIMGDLNAKVGSDNKDHESVMGKHGLGVRNENGENLVEFCELNNLVIAGTIFPHKPRHKVTWISPNGKTENQIDHILISKQHRTSCLDTRAMRGADASSDHELIRCKIRIKLKAFKKQTENRRIKFDTTKLQQPERKKAFTIALKNRFQVLEHMESVEEIWETMEKGYIETAKDILGVKKRGHKPWISKESWKLVDERKQVKQQMNNSRSERLKENLRSKYSRIDKEVKNSIRKDRRNWTEDLIEEAETAANKGHMKTIYEVTRVLSNERRTETSTLKDKDGNILSSQSEIKNRWKEHFNNVLNRPQPDNPLIVENDDNIIDEINTGVIDKEEIIKAMKKLKNGKSGGIDSITTEILKADMTITVKYLEKLFAAIWINETIPADWNKGLIVKIPKKGDKSVCDNYRGITLLSVPSKIFSRVIIQRIQNGIDDKLREEQAGFRRGRSTTEQLFTLRNILEQCNEWNAPLFINYVDFEKAFDSIHRNSLWSIMKHYGIPEKLIKMIKLLYDTFQCAVMVDGEESEWFRVTTGVKQGCTMSGFLFLLVIDYIMKKTTEREPTGIRWNFTTKLEDLDFADDLALLSSRHQDIQSKTQKLHEHAKQVGLKINIRKTKIMRLNTTIQDPVKIDDQQIEDVKTFTYLGGIVTTEGGCDQDINSRLGKAKQQFRRLKKIWNTSKFSVQTKLRLFNSLIVSVLTYGSETWKTTERDKKKLDTFQNRCLRNILRVRWPEKISNEELHVRARAKNISTIVMSRKWKWIGHILRFNNSNRICTTALTWHPEGKRKVGRPKTTWRRTTEQERNQLGWTTWAQARTAARDRQNWRRCIGTLCASRHEEDR